MLLVAREIIFIMKTNKKQTYLFVIMVIAIALLGIFHFVGKRFIHGALWTGDCNTYWKQLAYSIRGYNLKNVSKYNLVIDSIGEVSGSIMMPWARLIGNLLIPGFLPYKIACVYYYSLMMVCTLLLAKKIYEYFVKNEVIKITDGSTVVEKISNVCILLVTISITIAPFYWEDAFNVGNIGNVCSLCALLAAFYIEDKPNIASALLVISCIKPQIGAIFLVLLFFKRKYRIVFGSGIALVVLSIISELYTFIMTKARNISYVSDGMTSILTGYMNTDPSSEDMKWHYYFGIFTPLNGYGVSNIIVSILSALLGILILFLIVRYIEKNQVLSDDYIFLFGITSIICMVWAYKSISDEIIVILMNVVIILLWKYSSKNISDVLLIFIALFIFNCEVFRFWIKQLGIYDFVYADSYDVLLCLICLILTIYRLKKCICNRKNQDNL